MPRRYPSRPVVGVGAVVWRGNEVLLVKRGGPPMEGSWTLPGGAQDVGETIAEAARREIREEAGIEIDVHDVVAVVDLIDRDETGAVRFHYTVVDLLAEWRAGEARPGDDASALAWVSPDRLQTYGITSETQRVIALAAQKRALLDPTR